MQQFEAPARALDTTQLEEPACEQSLKGGGRVSIYRHRLSEANQYVRVSAPAVSKYLCICPANVDVQAHGGGLGEQ